MRAIWRRLIGLLEAHRALRVAFVPARFVRHVPCLVVRRFQILMAAILVLVPAGIYLAPSLVRTLFVLEPLGLVLIGFLGSVTALSVMLSARLAHRYGELRFGLTGCGQLPWLSLRRLLAYQVLALPLVGAAVVETSREAGAGLDLAVVAQNVYLAGLGMTCCLALAAAVPLAAAALGGADTDLSFIENDIFAWVRRRTLRLGRTRVVQAIRARLRRLPEAIGGGYVDYDTGRLLPGHLTAVAGMILLLILYATGSVVLDPGRSDLTSTVPPLAYGMFAFILLGAAVTGAAFFLDRFRVPVLLVAGVWVVLLWSPDGGDHYYRMRPLPEGQAVAARPLAAPTRGPVVVVAAEGGGLRAAGWTARVLAGLSDELGESFAGAIQLVSATSAASIGSMYYVAEYGDDALRAAPLRAGPRGAGPLRPLRRGADPVSGTGSADDRGRRVFDAASRSVSSEVAWGLLYPDLQRLLLPWWRDPQRDRAWAVEHAWRRAWPADSPMLAAWTRAVSAGARPAVAFNATDVVTGQRLVFATFRPPSVGGDADARTTLGRDARCDMEVVTAARLAASFPFISPVARPHGCDTQPAYHVTDGGYWDNTGTALAFEWLYAARQRLERRRVVLVRIRTLGREPAVARSTMSGGSGGSGGSGRSSWTGWLYQTVGPIMGLLAVREGAQRHRERFDLALLEDLWAATAGPGALHAATFQLEHPADTLGWHLTDAERRRVYDSWESAANRRERQRLQAFWNDARSASSRPAPPGR